MLWRLHLNPKNNKTREEVIEYCIKKKKIAGIGWPVSVKPQSVAHYVKLAKKEHGGYPASIPFARDVEKNHFIWTKDLKGVHYVGKVTSDWRYDDSTEALDYGVPNQRDCKWEKVGDVESVPGKVLASFRGGPAFQRIADEPGGIIEEISRRLACDGALKVKENIKTFLKKAKEEFPKKINAAEFFTLIDDQDCEDVAGLYLQKVRGYMIIPTSCKRDTLAYEFILKHKETGESASIQVKQGRVDLAGEKIGDTDKTFLFTTEGKIVPAPTDESVEILSPEDLYEFCCRHPELLTKRILTRLSILLR